MNKNEILQAIDQQITQLQQVRVLLVDSTVDAPATKPAGKRRGRPKGSITKKPQAVAPVAKKAARRTMSAEGKARIAAAQRARWAAQKKVTKPAAKKIAAKVARKPVTPIKKAVAAEA